VTSKQFIIRSAAGIAIFTVGVVLLDFYSDIYGLFRRAEQRRLAIYGEERTAKYLHSFRYIPENFQGVLFGSSVSDNLDFSVFPGYRIYNASINGGNVADLAPLVENVYRRRTMELTIVCIHRYLTLDHDRKTDLMSPRQYWGALGSPQLIAAQIARAAVRAGLGREEYDDRGTLHVEQEPSVRQVQRNIEKTLAEIRRGTASVGNYHIDATALAQLRDSIAAARSHSRRMLIFFPPTPETVLAAVSGDYSTYRDTILGILAPTDEVLDFNSPVYAQMRADPRNFVDAVHLSRTGARQVVMELGRATTEIDRRPTPSAAVYNH
jgi:hypothetical protein